MTQNYVNGFFTKCAELKVPYEMAVAMYKHATGCGGAPASKAAPAPATKKPAAGKVAVQTPNAGLAKLKGILAERKAKAQSAPAPTK